jgi:D-alanine-D-alanine ligase
MKIGVLCGGVSEEREISLRSGYAVFAALKRKGHEALFVDLKERGSARCEIMTLQLDLAFIALHGLFGEDGEVQILLEELKIPFTGSGSLASCAAFDKLRAKDVFRQQNIPTPHHEVVEQGADYGLPENLPVMVKPRSQGSSIGCHLVTHPDHWNTAIEDALSYDSRVLIEEYITGDELTVGVLRDQPLPVIRLLPKHPFYDYSAKYDPGNVVYEVPAQISERTRREVQRVAIQAHQALGCSGYSRVDLILDSKQKPWILEVNTVPGFTDQSLLPKAACKAGISFDDLVVEITQEAMERSRDVFTTQTVSGQS